MERKIRKKIRLKTYNYAQNGYYFITICTKDRKEWLCNKNAKLKEDNTFELSEIGRIVDNSINNIEEIYIEVKVDGYVIMPNHIHLLLSVENSSDISISRIIKQTKGLVTKITGFPIWQKSFYDHVIRNEQDYYEIMRYIQLNPLKWENDKYYKSELKDKL